MLHLSNIAPALGIKARKRWPDSLHKHLQQGWLVFGSAAAAPPSSVLYEQQHTS